MILEDPYLREAEREISSLLGEDDPHPAIAWCPDGFTLLPNGIEFRCPHGKRVPNVFVIAYSACQCDKNSRGLLEVKPTVAAPAIKTGRECPNCDSDEVFSDGDTQFEGTLHQCEQCGKWASIAVDAGRYALVDAPEVDL